MVSRVFWSRRSVAGLVSDVSKALQSTETSKPTNTNSHPSRLKLSATRLSGSHISPNYTCNPVSPSTEARRRSDHVSIKRVTWQSKCFKIQILYRLFIGTLC